MTPFELNLRNELDVERQRFANKWLFPWHNINIPNRMVEVEDFRGGKFAVGGIVFQGQIQDLYWKAIGRYLVGKVHGTFRKWDEETRSYPGNMRRSSLEGIDKLLMQFVAAIIEQATDTDRRLRGKGFPDKVPIYDASREHSHANAEIFRLAESHKAISENVLATTQPSRIQQFEALGTNYRGTIAILALVVAIMLGFWKVFVG